MGTPFDLLAYGFLMAVLGVTAAQFAPESGRALLLAGGTGGAIGLFWGLWGFRHHRYSHWASLTLAIFSLLLGGLNVFLWRAWAATRSELQLPLLLTGLMLFFSLAQLVLLWQENKAAPP